jgi:hypothetical protein
MGALRRVVPGAAVPATTSRRPEGRLLASGTPAAMLALQRAAGNAAVARMVAVQRADEASVAVTGVSTNHNRVTVPPQAGLSITATATPKKATGVTFSLTKGSVEPSGATIDPSSGRLTITAAQPGGDINVKATSDDGSFATSGLRIITKPTALASTSATDITSAGEYGGAFVHTFTGPGTAEAMQDARVNEKFAALEVTMPWGGKFTLKANKAGSAGWGLDSSGTMNGDDNVTIGVAGVDIGPLVASASNPSPKQTLPASFSMTQSLKAQSLPAKTWDETPFATTPHVRGVEESEGAVNVVVTAGGESVSQPYRGKPAFRNAQASASSVPASAPKPVAKKGEPAQEWQRETVTVSAEALPTDAPIRYSIVETGKARLGCEIDKVTGVVKIGDKPGTITVRASDGTAKPSHYDQVKVQITPRPAPPAADVAAPEGAAGESGQTFAEPPP